MCNLNVFFPSFFKLRRAIWPSAPGCSNNNICEKLAKNRFNIHCFNGLLCLYVVIINALIPLQLTGLFYSTIRQQNSEIYHICILTWVVCEVLSFNEETVSVRFISWLKFDLKSFTCPILNIEIKEKYNPTWFMRSERKCMAAVITVIFYVNVTNSKKSVDNQKPHQCCSVYVFNCFNVNSTCLCMDSLYVDNCVIELNKM